MAICIFQIAQSQTTWEEYNYATKGYKDAIEKGEDIKKGYRVQDIMNKRINWQNNEYTTAWLKALYRTATNKIAAYIVVYQLRDKRDNREYFCIPNPDSEQSILDSWLKSMNVGTLDLKGIYKLQTMLYTISLGLKW